MANVPPAVAVPDIARARLPGQFKLSVMNNRQWVSHQTAAWSIGLRWLIFEYKNTVHVPESPLFVAGLDDQYLAAVEQSSCVTWMQHHMPRHWEMHRTAAAFGLTPGGGCDLPTERIQIDRLLKEILDGDKIDLHGPAEIMASDDDHLQFLGNCMDYMQTFVGKQRFQLTQIGGCLPELSADLPIGRDAIYHGFALDVNVRLPHVILDSLAGRRLGDVIATGLVDLDQRTITGVITDQRETYDHLLPDGWVRVELNPDLVQLGKRTG